MRYITHEEQELFEKAMEKFNIKGYSFAPFVLYDKSETESEVRKKKPRARKPVRKK